MHKFWIIIAALLGFLGILIGAYSAHGLINLIDPNNYDHAKNSIDTAVRYQVLHALLLLVLALWMRISRSMRQNNFWQTLSASLILLGIFFFSGMIYLQYLLGFAGVAFLVPIGGTILLLGWLSLIAIVLFER